jgi:hypothetical protein
MLRASDSDAKWRVAQDGKAAMKAMIIKVVDEDGDGNNYVAREWLL